MSIVVIDQIIKATGNVNISAVPGKIIRVINTTGAEITATPFGVTAVPIAAGKYIDFWYDGGWYNSNSFSSSGGGGSSLTPVNITGDSTLASNTINYINATAMVTLTLPATCALGDKIVVIDNTGLGWKIKPNTGQSIKRYNRETPQGNNNFSFIQSNIAYVSIELLCVTANAKWSATSNTDVYRGKGYCMGGYTTAAVAVIEDMDFTFETSNAITATLNTAKYWGTGVNSIFKGYCMGGVAVNAVIEDMNFMTETSDVITATLNTGRYGSAGVSGNNKGYCMGGSSGVDLNTIEDMNFTTETSDVIADTLNGVRSGNIGVSGKAKGYSMGGLSTANIEDMNFTTEISTLIAATLNAARTQACGISGNLKGYCMGGNGGATTTAIDDMNFATETSDLLSATLNTAKQSGCGVSGINKGYHMGGTTGSAVAVIEDMNFIVDTSEVILATLNTAKYSGCGVSGCL